VIVISLVATVTMNVLTWISPFLSLIGALVVLAWWVLTSYAPLLVLDKGHDPIEAITESIALVKANAGRVVLILIAAAVVYIVGFCLCGVGLLVSAPVSLVAITYSYRALNNEPVVP